MKAGIDYGSKVAGTTVIARMVDGSLQLSQSEKGKDADSLIRKIIEEENIQLIAIDAPLSLPGKLVSIPEKSNYFFRDCDACLKAMSPMFIGGLTARAIKLKDTFSNQGRVCIEIYPKAYAEELSFNELYQKKNLLTLTDFMGKLQQEIPEFTFPQVNNWHQVDAILAFLIALKYEQGIHSQAGDPNEGLIIY